MIALYNCTFKDFKNVHLAPIINGIYENQKNINISKFNTCKTRNIALKHIECYSALAFLNLF